VIGGNLKIKIGRRQALSDSHISELENNQRGILKLNGLKPSISSHSKPHSRLRTRRFKCFVLKKLLSNFSAFVTNRILFLWFRDQRETQSANVLDVQTANKCVYYSKELKE
jgi:hypothetical protein